MLTMVRKTAMGWISRFRVSGDAKPVGAGGRGHYKRRAILGPGASLTEPKKPIAVGDQATEEIKRRQVSLVARYVTTMRAR